MSNVGSGSALAALLLRLHECDGLNGPAPSSSLQRLKEVFAGEPDPDVLALFEDHDGSDEALVWRGSVLAGRMMPVDEALRATGDLKNVAGATPGDILWMWSDDSSNYAGLFTSGPVAGFVTVLDHDEPRVAPRFSSAISFMNALLAGVETDDPPSDIPSVDCEFPTTRDEADEVQRLRALSSTLLSLWRAEGSRGESANHELRRAWAWAALCLLPVADTHLALEMLNDSDMWTPESAVALLEVRSHGAAVPELERLAREGSANGDGAAIRALVRLRTPEAQDALKRLDEALSGRKRSLLDMYRRARLAPARW